ncbi:hypothetical protein IV203_029731 [Nitzschia inconspicua]|uniref:Uncharacterized protein n=1 Tax=Nitzschia inconspicua TaxID=303405 RepID=A0A9K3Q197_9STRA|nr:hypothetical protein IV203_029731 [Nitzschia inconspicua]
MTAILGDKGRNGTEHSLPDAAVALAAMNRIPAVLPPRYNKQQQQPELSPAVHANTLQSQEIRAVSHSLEQDLSQVHLQAQIMVPHKQQDLYHHEAVSLCGQPSKYMHQTQAQPQSQPMNQVPSLFSEVQHSLHQQQGKQPVCDVHRGVNVPSYPIDSSSNCNEMSRQVTALHTNHDTQHPNSTMHQIAPDSNGHFEREEHCQEPLTQQVVVVAQQQDIQYQVAPQQPAQQVIQNLPQQGLQMAQLRLQQQSQQNATQVDYIALNQEQANVQLPQSQFINTQQQQPQFELQSHFETLRDQTQHAGNQETHQNQYIPVLQDHKALHIHSTEQQQFGQDLQHVVFGENAPLVSHATQTTQGQYDLLQSQHTDSLQHQHCLQDGFQSKHDQFAASQKSPHEQYRTPVHQQQNQGRGLQQAFSGHSDQFQQIQQDATQLPGQHQYTETSQPQQQLQQVPQHSHNGQQLVNSHNQPNSGSQYHDSSGQQLPVGQILQVAVHQHTNHQIQVQNNVLQQQEQQVHIPSHAPEVQQLQQSWTTHQLPQTQQVPHPSHQRHHRRLHSQPVFLQQGQIPEPQTNHHRRQQSQPAFFQPGHSIEQNRHRRQFSQPVYLHDMGFGQVHSSGQEEKNVAQPIEQNVLHLFQQAGSSTALPATPFQNTAQDIHVASQQGSHSSFQQQHQEQQQQPQVLPQGSFQQESQTHPQVFHTETVHPDHTHNYLNTQGSSYQQSQQHTIVQSQEAHGHSANADQHVVPHHQDFGSDPLYIHHEMHVAQATGDPFNQDNDQ